MKKLFNPIMLTMLVLASILFQISGCKKDDAQVTNPSTSYPIQGLWIGTYTVDGQSNLGEQYFSFTIKPDGTLVTETKAGGQQHLCIGNWTLNGTTLNCTFTSVYGLPGNIGATQVSTTTWDKNGKLTGTWKDTAPRTNSGSIKLTRIN